MPREGNQLDNRIAAAVLDLIKNTVFTDAVLVTELRITRKADHWLAMVKGERGGQKLVSFYTAMRYEDALVLTATTADCQKARWVKDKWPPKK